MIFTANALPPLPASQVYQLWIVTAAGPLSAGLLEPRRRRAARSSSPAPPRRSQPAAFAVTVEPAGGVPAPTGARVLVGGV